MLFNLGGAGRAFTMSVFGVGIGLILLGGWMVRPSRKAVMADRLAAAPPVTAIWMKESSSVTLHRSKYDMRVFEISINDAPVLLVGNRVRLGSDQEWKLRVSAKRASIRAGRESVARATRGPGKPSQWVINDGTREYWISKSQDRTVDMVPSSTHVWGKDRTTVTRRQGILSTSEGGTPVAVIDLTYTVQSKLTRKLDTKSQMFGEFSGGIDLRSPVPVPVAILSLRLALSRWAKRPPKTGEWVYHPPAGG